MVSFQDNRVQELRQSPSLPSGLVFAETKRDLLRAFREPGTAAVCWRGDGRLSSEALEAIKEFFLNRAIFELSR
ncbi:MAG: hypothetical protein R3A13_03085 [Bdellovibrionota bacterium]